MSGGTNPILNALVESGAIWFLVGVFAIRLAIEIFKPVKKGRRSASAESKGAEGEKNFYLILLGNLLPWKYRIIRDVYLPLADGTTTQIDFIIVSEFGIFVIETKNYSGWIFGDAKSQDWTQSLPKQKSRFQNPLRQNYLHTETLKSTLGLPSEIVFSVVAFSDKALFKTDMPKGVFYFSEVPRYIKSFTKPLIKKGQVPEIVKVINEWQSSIPKDVKRRHVDNLRAKSGATIVD